MIISIDKLISKYDLSINTLLHVGACRAEEKRAYLSNGVKKIIWVEANPALCEFLEQKVADENNIIVNAAVSQKDGEIVTFNFANNEQSSSILPLGTHKQLFPGVYYTNRAFLETKSLKSILEELKVGKEDVDFINLDIQGAELLALKGCGEEYLNNIQGVYTEINTEYVYENCALVGEIDDFLGHYGFERVETKMWDNNHPWGDAFYLKGGK